MLFKKIPFKLNANINFRSFYSSAFACVLIIIPFYFTSVFANVYPMPANGDAVIGSIFTIQVKKGDSVKDIRMRYELSLEELLAANPQLKNRRPKIDEILFIPTEHILPVYRKGLVLNMPELRLYYFSPDSKYVYTFPVAMGRPNWRTPTVATKIVRKVEDPIWYVPKSVHAYMLDKHNLDLPDFILPGPKNPLGKYALYLGTPGYLIHGTNEPSSVGTFASSGCMRMSSSAIEMLYENVPVGTNVYILNHALKVGWLNGKLYMEAHAPVALDDQQTATALNSVNVENAIDKAVQAKPAIIDWNRVHEIIASSDGVPHEIGR